MFKQFVGGSKLAKLAGITLATGVIAAAFHTTAPVKASDHDDGETNIKARNLNLTDLYVFREDWQTGVNAAPANQNMIFIMNTNPRSLPRQQYFFNTNAVYSFFVSRRAGQDDDVTGVPDLAFDFNFGQPSNAGSQSITLNIRRFTNGQVTATETLNAGTTTAAPVIDDPNTKPFPNPTNNPVTTTNGDLTVFAGLREDPFFFDVDAFFRTRAAIAPFNSPSPANVGNRGTGLLTAGTNIPANAIDFAKGYNVNAIVMRVPITLLRGGTNDGIFDVWETIAVPDSFAALQ
ncbi:MAG: DUF4331 family protein [Candidatus Eremiobacteraeota bacterium]|nr:DUF4331 family protein [Candidatus Eremiobacteraeota bacterium]MCW5871930.1 DUF4331 family protein [Candidatus Eremiobacteraeota bacterium]